MAQVIHSLRAATLTLFFFSPPLLAMGALTCIWHDFLAASTPTLAENPANRLLL
jgi:hypothetical protein